MRVYHCDDSDSYRRLVELTLGDHAGVEIVGGAGDRETALEEIAATQPDVVLLDAIAPDFGPDLVDDIAATAPRAKVVVLSGHPDATRRERPGIAAVVGKHEAIDRLEAVLREVLA